MNSTLSNRFKRNHPGTPGRLSGAFGGDFSRQELDTLGRIGTMATVRAGRELITEGAIGNEAFVIHEGTASVERNGEVIASVGPGAIFGEGALMERTRRNASVTATTEVTVFVLTPNEFSSVLQQCPRLDTEIRAIAAARNGDASN